MLRDSSFRSPSSQERVECLQRPCGRPEASRKHRLHNLSKFHNSAISIWPTDDVNWANSATFDGLNGTLAVLVGWAESSRPTVLLSIPMVGLEDSVHPTVKKLRSAFRFPSLTTSGWLAIVKFGSEMVGQARFVLARGVRGILGRSQDRSTTDHSPGSHDDQSRFEEFPTATIGSANPSER